VCPFRSDVYGSSPPMTSGEQTKATSFVRPLPRETHPRAGPTSPLPAKHETSFSYTATPYITLSAISQPEIETTAWRAQCRRPGATQIQKKLYEAGFVFRGVSRRIAGKKDLAQQRPRLTRFGMETMQHFRRRRAEDLRPDDMRSVKAGGRRIAGPHPCPDGYRASPGHLPAHGMASLPVTARSRRV